MNPSELKPETIALALRLQSHPELNTQVAALLDEVENRAGKLNTGDEAEDAIVERMRQMGGQALTQWAEQRHEAVQPVRSSGLRKVGKKNSAGKRPSAPSS
jgi:hypothetical protein